MNTFLSLHGIGYDPQGLNLGAIIDNGQLETLCDTKLDHSISSVRRQTEIDYPCRLLDIIEKLGVNWVPLTTELDVEQAIKAGDLMGYLKFPENFTENMRKRFVWRIYADEETLNGSTISIRLDNSEYMNTYFITKSLYESVQKFLLSSANDYDVDERTVTLPLQFSPIYGSLFHTWNSFIVSAELLLLWTFFSTTFGFFHVIDRCDNTFARTMATGVDFGQLQLSYYFSDIPLSFFQGGLILLIFWWDRGEQVQGSWILIGVIFYLARMAILSLYFVVGTFNMNVKDMTLLTISIIMVYVYASDTIWPIESVVWWYRPFCHCLPFTVTIRVLRSVITRGWGITHPTVFFGGICVPIIITGISTMVSFVVERRNKKL
ncbi:uncharacterized protein LOC110862362 [Folsomia candida]|nr:uncharacterized protein LOC110862362 [Folsomia candida]